MTIASGIFKKVAFKVETTWGTAATAAGAQYLRRVTSNLNLTKATYESNEIRDDQQVADFRHGTRSVTGSVNGELSGGTHQAFVEAMLRADATAVATIAALTLTTAAAAPNYTITRSAGSWITDGIRVGMVVRVSAGLNALTLNRNFYVVSLTATVMTVNALDNGTITIESAVASCSVIIPGKRTFVPSTGHTNKSYTIEEWHSDIGNLSRLFVGCKPSQMAIKMPATGMSTIDLSFMGKDITVGTTQYFTTPTAIGTSGIMAAVNGSVFVQGVEVALITGLDLTIAGGHTAGNVIGANTTPDVFPGRIKGSGQATVYLLDSSFLNYFVNETEVEIVAILTATTASNSDFVVVHLPRVKFGGATADDGEKGLIQTMPFVVLKKAVTVGYDSTEISIQDSLYV